jgi:hypothetical protein
VHTALAGFNSPSVHFAGRREVTSVRSTSLGPTAQGFYGGHTVLNSEDLDAAIKWARHLVDAAKRARNQRAIEENTRLLKVLLGGRG